MGLPDRHCRPAARPATRGLTLLAVLALLACAAPSQSADARRDARAGARLALASATAIAALLTPARVEQDAPLALDTRPAVRSGSSQDGIGPAVAPVACDASMGLIDLPPPVC